MMKRILNDEPLWEDMLRSIAKASFEAICGDDRTISVIELQRWLSKDWLQLKASTVESIDRCTSLHAEGQSRSAALDSAASNASRRLSAESAHEVELMEARAAAMVQKHWRSMQAKRLVHSKREQMKKIQKVTMFSGHSFQKRGDNGGSKSHTSLVPCGFYAAPHPNTCDVDFHRAFQQPKVQLQNARSSSLARRVPQKNFHESLGSSAMQAPSRASWAQQVPGGPAEVPVVRSDAEVARDMQASKHVAQSCASPQHAAQPAQQLMGSGLWMLSGRGLAERYLSETNLRKPRSKPPGGSSSASPHSRPSPDGSLASPMPPNTPRSTPRAPHSSTRISSAGEDARSYAAADALQLLLDYIQFANQAQAQAKGQIRRVGRGGENTQSSSLAVNRRAARQSLFRQIHRPSFTDGRMN